MAYIGNQPTDNFVTFATQNFSTSATSSYTLTHAVSNENEIALFINNVRQHPGSGKAYTATGTALTLSENTASTDVMYCIFLGRAIQSTVPSTNSITPAMLGTTTVTALTAGTGITGGTGTEDAAVTGLTNQVQMCDSGDLALGSVISIPTPPAADKYMYMVTGAATDANYTAGKILIEFFGYV